MLLTLLLIATLSSNELQKKPFLSDSEVEFLSKKDSIVACVYTVMLEDHKIDDRVDIGLGRDVVKLLQEHMSVPIQTKIFSNLKKLLESAKSRECDMVGVLEETDSRLEFFDFTDPYIKLPIVMATKSGLPFVNNINILGNKKIAIVRGNSYIDRIKTKYPNLDIALVDSNEEGIDRVRRGEVFGLLGFAQILNYAFLEKNIKDLDITVQFDESVELSIASRNDIPSLGILLQEKLNEIEPNKLNEVLNNWYKIGYEVKEDNGLLYQLMFFCVVIAGVFLYWHLQLKDELKSSEKKQFLLMRQNRFAQMGEMIENIAHQWRQPLAQLNSNVWVLSLLLENERILKRKEITYHLDEIERTTNYMSKTIDDFREFFHPDRQKQRFTLGELFEDILLILKGTLRSNRINLQLDIDQNLSLYSYKKELEHIVIIILNNAKDALIAQKIEHPLIKISNKKLDNKIEIEICDNAKGIKNEHLERIFEPYFTTKHKSQSTGLGLYMAKTLVEKALEGSLDVHNSKDGACFVVSIPIGAENEQQIQL